jgi:hypothetical protein
VKEEICEESKQMIDINIEEEKHESMFEILEPEMTDCLFDKQPENSDSEGEND